MPADRTPLTEAFADLPRLWLGPTDVGFATRILRRTFTLDRPPTAAKLHLFVEHRYLLWVNGTFIGRGPHFHHATRLPITTYDLTPHLTAGRNVVAVLVNHNIEAFHNHVPTGKPGLVARLNITDASGEVTTIDTDAQWKASDRTGWRQATPRRSWAVDHLEIYDVAAAPAGWQSAEFDDSDWLAADVLDTALADESCTFFEADLPMLRFAFAPAQQLIGFQQTDAAPVEIQSDFKHGTYGEQLMAAPRLEPTDVKIEGDLDDAGGGLRITGLSASAGAIVELDLGSEHAGHLVLECDCESAGVIDAGWSEHCRLGFPTVLQKGTSYADQIHAAPGDNQWMPLQFNAGRYLKLFFRAFTGSVTIKRAGFWASEPDLDWRGHFECNDEKLNAIWELCKRSQIVGTQEGLMDCPTREQASYVGDGHPVAWWIALLTGDVRFWSYLTAEQFERPSKEGLILSTPFSGVNNTLLDYTILAVIWSVEHADFMGDDELLERYAPVCRSILRYFDDRTDDRGLFNWQWTKDRPHKPWQHLYDPQLPNFGDSLNLFIDHPGMGWHNVGEPGIDRRGINGAINALRVRGLAALSDIEARLGNAEPSQKLAKQAEQLRQTVTDAFYSTDHDAFVDGELAGELIDSVSEQTNTWALQAGAGAMDTDARRALLARLLDEGKAKRIAEAGPYFWIYIFDMVQRLGLEEKALELLREKWWVMIEGDATTLWETWAGDDLDTWCHPWSGGALEFLLGGVCGLPTRSAKDGRYELKPRFDLLESASARLCLPVGDFAMNWTTDSNRVTCAGTLPGGVEATLIDPAGGSHVIQGDWRIETKLIGYRPAHLETPRRACAFSTTPGEQQRPKTRPDNTTP